MSRPQVINVSPSTNYWFCRLHRKNYKSGQNCYRCDDNERQLREKEKSLKAKEFLVPQQPKPFVGDECSCGGELEQSEFFDTKVCVDCKRWFNVK